MDRLIARNTVPFGSHDTAPPTGTPGLATDGNPVTAIPQTVWPAYGWNMLSEEVLNVIRAAGIAPAGGDWTQLLAAILSVTGGRLIRTTRLAAFGVSTFTPVGNTKLTRFRIQGGGGAGSGCNVPSPSNISLGAPGTCGGYLEILANAVQVGSGQVVTVGSGGASTAGAGGPGGASSVGSLGTAPGGIGGLLRGTVPAPTQNGNGNQTALPSVAAGISTILALVGGAESISLGFDSNGNGAGGAGGRSQFGVGGFGVTANGNGTGGVNAGAGGSGTFATSATSVPLVGGSGAQGTVIIEEYS